jgi:hypothetical protein
VRLQRLQSIEFLWKGTQYLTYKVNLKGKYISRRTSILYYLTEAMNIKSLKVYVQESQNVRRQHETQAIARYLSIQTEHQPNQRSKRALRLLQGLDYLTAMRGLKVVEFYDFDQWLAFRQIQSVKDFTFVEDVANQVFRAKDCENEFLSQWKNLAPTVRNFVPVAEMWEVLETFMASKNPVPDPQGPPQPEGYVPLGIRSFSPIELSSDSDDSGVDMDVEDDADDESSLDANGSHSSQDNDSDADSSDGSANDSNHEDHPAAHSHTGLSSASQQPVLVIDDDEDDTDIHDSEVRGIDRNMTLRRGQTAESSLFVRGHSVELGDESAESTSTESHLFVSHSVALNIHSPTPGVNSSGRLPSEVPGPGTRPDPESRPVICIDESEDVEMEDADDAEDEKPPQSGGDGDTGMGGTQIDLTGDD